ncbi:MAG: LacI family DNA-binding transcriptional regulator [Limnochordales bacterium]|nr:LacI family DNA-binding transcriptional regulator [Limnochordales bacterium]
MPTIRDVAALAGVSITTVSRVINGKSSQIPISEATRDRILAAIQTLGYEPNVMAKGLAGRRSHAIGLVMYDLVHITHPNFSQIAHGIATALSDCSYDLMLLPIKGKLPQKSSKPVSMASYYKQRRVDGLIVAAQEASVESILELHAIGCPFVLLGTYLPGKDVPCVRVDAQGGIAQAVTHLVGLGHRRIGFINGPVGFRINDDMAVGYRQVLEPLGLYDPALLVSSDFTPKATRERAHQLLAMPDRPTAILAADDLMAAEVVQVAREVGLSVPDNLSVVGYADLPVARTLSPTLTTVRIPISESGRLAAEMLLQLLDGAKPEVACITLPAELVVRQSTSAPP